MAGRGSQIKKSCDCCKRYMDHLGGKINCFVRRMTANFKHSMKLSIMQLKEVMSNDCLELLSLCNLPVSIKRQQLSVMDDRIVPNRFLNHFGGKISGTIKLESPNGILYVVEVTKHMNKTVLRCGWEAFVDAHHIEENDSLLFRHTENSHFKVLILDSDDCEKVFSCAGINNTSGIQERNAYSVDISSSSRDDTIKTSGSKRFSRCQRGGSSHRRKTAKLAATSSSSEESGKDSPSEYRSLDSDDLQTTPGPDYVLSRRNYLSETQKEKVVALIQEIQPEIPVFVAIIKKCHVQPPSPYLIISKEYAVVHFPHESATVTLQRPGKSKKWHPKFYMRKDRSMHILRGHWIDFVHDNRVQEGDICIFVPAKDGRRSKFTVHLLHGETTHSRVGTGVQKVGSRHGRTNTKIASAVHIKEEPTDGENVSSEINRHEISHESLECADSHGRPSKPPYIIPSKSSLSPLQKKIVEEKVQAIQSEAPLYVAIMKKSSVRANQQAILEIGARYAAEHLPDRNQTMLLQWMGEIWRTEMQIRNGKRWFLVGGWCKFVRDNRLRVGDICLFELKKNERKLTMTVNIIFSEQF